jgi:AraC family ethanolamine operon transcriptional activator
VSSLTRLVPDRRPLPGGARDAPSRTPPFPAGLVLDVRATTGQELRAASVGWDVRYAQLGAGGFRGRWVGAHTRAAQVFCEDWSVGVLKLGVAPRGSVTFLVPVAGSSRIQGRPVSTGQVVVLFDREELDYRSAGPARLLGVSMERTALEGHVRALLGRHLGELRLQARLGRMRTDAAVLARLVRGLAARAADHPRLLRDAALATALERRLIKVLFRGFETPCELEAEGRGRRLARRAEAWLRQNLAEPPTITVLCGALHASERTVHEAFRKHMGTTPKAYLKTLRLNAARQDLLDGVARTRVTDVALDWGFVHFGWFSQDYRRLFGETPSQTLQRGRADGGGRGLAPGGAAGSMIWPPLPRREPLAFASWESQQ